MATTLKDLEPYLTLATTVFSVASLGFLLSLLKEMRESARERAAVMKDRLDGAKEDLERTEKWHTREQKRLRAELDKLNNELITALSSEGLNLQALALGRDLRDAAEEARTNVRSLVAEMQRKLEEFKQQGADATDLRQHGA